MAQDQAVQWLHVTLHSAPLAVDAHVYDPTTYNIHSYTVYKMDSSHRHPQQSKQIV